MVKRSAVVGLLLSIVLCVASTAMAAQDGGYDVTSELWVKTVLQVPGDPVTLVWNEVGADTTPSGDRVVSGYFYADPNDFAYGSQYNPEVFVKIYIAKNGWCNIAFNHVTVDDVIVYSAHQYSGVADNQGTISLKSRLVEQQYTGFSVPSTIDNDGDGFTIGGGDCNDQNSNVHPNASEICGDGIDQNCDGNDEECGTATTEYVKISNITPIEGTVIDKGADLRNNVDFSVTIEWSIEGDIAEITGGWETLSGGLGPVCHDQPGQDYWNPNDCFDDIVVTKKQGYLTFSWTNHVWIGYPDPPVFRINMWTENGYYTDSATYY